MLKETCGVDDIDKDAEDKTAELILVTSDVFAAAATVKLLLAIASHTVRKLLKIYICASLVRYLFHCRLSVRNTISVLKYQ